MRENSSNVTLLETEHRVYKMIDYPFVCFSFAVRKWKEVVGVSCPELQAVLLEAREKEGEAAQMIFPLPSHRSIKHREYETFTVILSLLSSSF